MHWNNHGAIEPKLSEASVGNFCYEWILSPLEDVKEQGWAGLAECAVWSRLALPEALHVKVKAVAAASW